MPTAPYRTGLELEVPANATELTFRCYFRLTFVLAELSAPPGYVMARGVVRGETDERLLCLPLGLQVANPGTVYGQHAYVPENQHVRGYVLQTQGPSRYPRVNYPAGNHQPPPAGY